jgi:hypothetical protein
MTPFHAAVLPPFCCLNDDVTVKFLFFAAKSIIPYHHTHSTNERHGGWNDKLLKTQRTRNIWLRWWLGPLFSKPKGKVRDRQKDVEQIVGIKNKMSDEDFQVPILM